MKYLIDTHILLWLIYEPEKLSSSTRKILFNGNVQVYVSAVSFWEISLKHSLGKLYLENISPENLPALCVELKLLTIPITVNESATLNNLSADFHKDPFDRMLIWQCLKNDFIFISDDKNVKKYSAIGLKVIS